MFFNTGGKSQGDCFRSLEDVHCGGAQSSCPLTAQTEELMSAAVSHLYS